MELEKLWQKALKKTEIHRARLHNLYTFRPTDLPYVLLTESKVNPGDTVVRKGKIKVDKPLIVLPEYHPLFEGFDFAEDLKVDDDLVRAFLLLRGLNLPSLKYKNRTYSLDVYEDTLKKALGHYKNDLQRKEDTYLGLVVGPDDAWQFSLLIYVAAMVSKSAASDISKYLRRLKEEGGFEKDL
jgi:hypothetical protein